MMATAYAVPVSGAFDLIYRRWRNHKRTFGIIMVSITILMPFGFEHFAAGRKMFPAFVGWVAGCSLSAYHFARPLKMLVSRISLRIDTNVVDQQTLWERSRRTGISRPMPAHRKFKKNELWMIITPFLPRR